MKDRPRGRTGFVQSALFAVVAVEMPDGRGTSSTLMRTQSPAPVVTRFLASFDGATLQSYGGRMAGTDLADLRHLVDAGNEEAADRLAFLAAEDGDVDTLKYLIDAGNESAGNLLARRAAEQGDLETLGYLIDNGVMSAVGLRAEIASEMGDAVALQQLADEGSEVAQTLLTRTISDTE
jgi:hypothetical protein